MEAQATPQAADHYAATMKDLYIETASGKQFYLSHSPVDIEDIASALSKLCRFNGHCNRMYTVAQHSMLVSEIMCLLNMGDPFEGLMHDAAEAYLADIPSPWKSLIPDYKRIEQTLETRIRQQYDLPFNITAECKRADYIALFIEADYLIPSQGKDWPAPDGIKEAAKIFMAMFETRSFFYTRDPYFTRLTFMDMFRKYMD